MLNCCELQFASFFTFLIGLQSIKAISQRNSMGLCMKFIEFYGVYVRFSVKLSTLCTFHQFQYFGEKINSESFNVGNQCGIKKHNESVIFNYICIFSSIKQQFWVFSLFSVFYEFFGEFHSIHLNVWEFIEFYCLLFEAPISKKQEKKKEYIYSKMWIYSLLLVGIF